MIVDDKSRRLVIVYRQAGDPELSRIAQLRKARFLKDGDTTHLEGTPFDRKAEVYGPSLYHLDEAFASGRRW